MKAILLCADSHNRSSMFSVSRKVGRLALIEELSYTPEVLDTIHAVRNNADASFNVRGKLKTVPTGTESQSGGGCALMLASGELSVETEMLSIVWSGTFGHDETSFADNANGSIQVDQVIDSWSHIEGYVSVMMRSDELSHMARWRWEGNDTVHLVIARLAGRSVLAFGQWDDPFLHAWICEEADVTGRGSFCLHPLPNGSVELVGVREDFSSQLPGIIPDPLTYSTVNDDEQGTADAFGTLFTQMNAESVTDGAQWRMLLGLYTAASPLPSPVRKRVIDVFLSSCDGLSSCRLRRAFHLIVRSFLWDKAWTNGSFDDRIALLMQAISEMTGSGRGDRTTNYLHSAPKFLHHDGAFPRSTAQAMCDDMWMECSRLLQSVTEPFPRKWQALHIMDELLSLMERCKRKSCFDYALNDASLGALDSNMVTRAIVDGFAKIQSEFPEEARGVHFSRIEYRFIDGHKLATSADVIHFLSLLPRTWALDIANERPMSGPAKAIWYRLAGTQPPPVMLGDIMELADASSATAALTFTIHWCAFNAMLTKQGQARNNYAMIPKLSATSRAHEHPDELIRFFFEKQAAKIHQLPQTVEAFNDWFNRLHTAYPWKVSCMNFQGEAARPSKRAVIILKAVALTILANELPRSGAPPSEAINILYSLGVELLANAQRTVIGDEIVDGSCIMTKVLAWHRQSEAPAMTMDRALHAMLWKAVHSSQNDNTALDELFSALSLSGMSWPKNHLSFLLTLFFPRDSRVQAFCEQWSATSNLQRIGSGTFGNVFLVNNSTRLTQSMEQELVVKVFARSETNSPFESITPNPSRSLQQGTPADVTVWQTISASLAFGAVEMKNMFVLPLGTQVHKGELLLLMPHVPEGTLSRYVFRQQQEGNHGCELNTLRRLLRDVLIGLQALHDRLGLVHNDIKPENILVRRKRGTLRATIADFGLCRINGCDSGCSPLYKPPEERCSFAKDIWAFACIVVQAGCAPIRSRVQWDTCSIRADENIVQSAEYFAPGDTRFLQTLRRCFSQDPQCRPTATELLELSCFRAKELFSPIGSALHDADDATSSDISVTSSSSSSSSPSSSSSSDSDS